MLLTQVLLAAWNCKFSGDTCPLNCVQVYHSSIVGSLKPPVSEVGSDALIEPMSIDNFMNSVSRKKIGIKALLLDQMMRCFTRYSYKKLWGLHQIQQLNFDLIMGLEMYGSWDRALTTCPWLLEIWLYKGRNYKFVILSINSLQLMIQLSQLESVWSYP